MAIQDELPESRVTLTYRTTINGVEEDQSLPLRLLVLGDFSGGTSEDRKNDLGARKVRSITGQDFGALMKDMKISTTFSVPNRIDPDHDGQLHVKLNIDSLKSFSPDSIASQVPKLRSLLLLKTLLQEIQSNIDNRKELRKLLNDLMADPTELKATLAQLQAYAGLKLPDSTTTPSESKPPQLASGTSTPVP